MALTLTGNIASTGGAITIDNSFGSTNADKNVTLGADIVIRGGDILIDLGGGTSGTTHTGTIGGTFAADGHTLHTYSGNDTSNSSNLAIVANAITYGAALPSGTIYIDAGTAKLLSYKGSAIYNANDGKDFVVLGANSAEKGAVSVAVVTSLFSGATFTASNVAGTVFAGTDAEKNVSFTGDIYINGGTTDFSTITSTGGRVLFVGNYSDTSTGFDCEGE